jgi:hypothetical protein
MIYTTEWWFGVGWGCKDGNNTDVRGTTANCIVFDEAAFASPKTFHTILPLLTNQHTSLICTSTPSEPENFYEKLVASAEADPLSPFHVIRIGRSCEACILKGVAHLCTHPYTRVNDIAGWKETKREKLIQEMMPKDMFNTEIRGMQALSTADKAFPREMVIALRDRPHLELNACRSRVQAIFVGIDPSGGASKSNYAIVSLTFVERRCVVSNQHQYRCR